MIDIKAETRRIVEITMDRVWTRNELGAAIIDLVTRVQDELREAYAVMAEGFDADVADDIAAKIRGSK